MLDLYRHVRLAVILASGFSTFAGVEQTATSGTFVLHKFAKAIGSETYSIEAKDASYTLTSHFVFTDRGKEVPLDTTFVAEAGSMKPVSYSAKGKASRISDMDDEVTVSGQNVSITRSGKSEKQTASEPWFITDGYSPGAMQEQMMRWWLSHDRPESFTVYPSKARVRIAAAENLSIAGVPAHGYAVSGLIWGQESLWMDGSQNLMALVSADAECDGLTFDCCDYFSGLRKMRAPIGVVRILDEMRCNFTANFKIYLGLSRPGCGNRRGR